MEKYKIAFHLELLRECESAATLWSKQITDYFVIVVSSQSYLISIFI